MVPTSAEARCLVCKKYFGISLMGVSALASLAYGKKHQSKLSGKNSSMDIRLLLGSSNNSEKSETSDKQTNSTDRQQAQRKKQLTN